MVMEMFYGNVLEFDGVNVNIMVEKVYNSFSRCSHRVKLGKKYMGVSVFFVKTAYDYLKYTISK